MSIRSAVDDTNRRAGIDPTDRLAFVGQVHRLLALGYARLDVRNYHGADENRLNQVFVAALRQVTEDTQAPPWASRFSIHEKGKQNDGTLEGNSRLELDVVLERTGRGPHPRFVIEAKRLGLGHPVTIYLGSEGLGAFISCAYAKEHDDAGMLGYVQSKTIDTWCDSLGRELAASPGKYGVEPNVKWCRQEFRGGPAMTYRSRHTRSKGHRPITIYHTLLDFTP